MDKRSVSTSQMPPSYAQATGVTYQLPSQAHMGAGAGGGVNVGTGMNYTTMTQAPVVIIQQQTALPLGPESAYITCPFCHVQKLTRIEYEPSSRTHLVAALLCVLGLWCCVCLPYCAGSCMNANHYCGNCNKFVGVYNNSL